MLKFYNTLSKKIEVFTPLKKKSVGMYVCGPTVYKDQHIGNYRTFIFADIVRRTLIANRYTPTFIVNITDVGHLTSDSDTGEDKLEKEARAKDLSAKQIARNFEKRFRKELAKLNILPADKFPRASLHIKGQIAMIEQLEKKGYTYATSDGIYFDTKKFKGYGKLAPKNLAGQKDGARISKGDKKNASDFALWKFSPRSEKRDMEWASPWGKGFPGWHLECSAMSMKYLGDSFDIHLGGIDHVPIHHTNEIAQSEAATGKPFVKYWLHPNHLNVGEKMSKSKGTSITIDDIIARGFDPLDFRYLTLQSLWSSPTNFTWESLEAARTAREKLLRYATTAKVKDVNTKIKPSLLAALNDNFHTPKLLATLWEAVDQNLIGRKTLLWLDDILAIGIAEAKPLKIPKTITALLNKRELYRKEKNWEMSDKIRDQLHKEGWEINDGEKGATAQPIK